MLKENTDHRKYRDNEYEQELTKDFQEAEKNNFDSPEEKALDEKNGSGVLKKLVLIWKS